MRIKDLAQGEVVSTYSAWKYRLDEATKRLEYLKSVTPLHPTRPDYISTNSPTTSIQKQFFDAHAMAIQETVEIISDLTPKLVSLQNAIDIAKIGPYSYNRSKEFHYVDPNYMEEEDDD